MLTSIDRYLLRRLLSVFLPAIVGTSFLLFVGGTFRLVKDEDVSIAQIAMALPWVLPYLLPALIPLAYAVTLTLVLGRMVADNELVALNVLGIPWRAVFRPCLLLGAGLSICSLILLISVVPYSHQMRKNAGAATYLQLTSAGSGEHMSRRFGNQGLTVYIRRYGPDGLEGLVLHADTFFGGNSEEDRRSFHVTARRGSFEIEDVTRAVLLVMQDVTLTVDGGAGSGIETPIRVHLQRYVQRLTLGGWRRIKTSDYSSAQLREILSTQHRLDLMAANVGGLAGAGRGRWVERRHEASLELHSRIAMALAPLLLTAFVAPLTILLRARNALVPFALGLGSGSIIYFVPTLLGQSLADSTGVSQLVYLGCLATLAVGGLTVRTADRI